MGLLKSAILAGGVVYAGRAVGKGVFAHTEAKYAQQHPEYQQPPQYQPQGQHYDNTGYQHQSWCNGSCGHQCNGKAH